MRRIRGDMRGGEGGREGGGTNSVKRGLYNLLNPVLYVSRVPSGYFKPLKSGHIYSHAEHF